MFRKFARDRAGNIAPMFAIAALPLVAMTGAVVDYTNGFQQREIIQDALDAAAVAANRLNGIEPQSKVLAEALAIYKANTEGKIDSPPTMAVSIAAGTVETSTTLKVDNYFLGIAGLKEQIYDLSAKAVTGNATFEVVMVLDNSGSMRGSKIASLRSAAHDLTGILFDANKHNPKKDPIKIGVVPFSRYVNVGPTYANASWLDGNGVGTYHYENFDANVKRLDLFNQLTDVSWQGCVEARPYPNDVRDVAPTPTDATTMIVPLFAPDEPDKYGYSNSYVSDEGGTCGSANGVSDPDRQARTCKYQGVKTNQASNNGVSRGPNVGCTANPLQPMTTIRGQVESEIAKLKASGMTNIHQGVMYGWRLLSPSEPFTEGRPYNTKDNNKILIVMTDGANTYNYASNFNKSGYGAYGYVAKQHLGAGVSTNSQVVAKMNERTLEACTNVKAEGIRVYTIAFKVSSNTTKEMMKSCASDVSMYFDSGSNSDLIATFEMIGQEITQLRLEQ